MRYSLFTVVAGALALTIATDELLAQSSFSGFGVTSDAFSGQRGSAFGGTGDENGSARRAGSGSGQGEGLFGDNRGILGGVGLSSLFFESGNRAESLRPGNQFGIGSGFGANPFNNQFRGNRRFERNQSDQNRPTARTQLRVGFSFTAANMNDVQAKLQQHLATAKFSTVGSIEVIIADQQTEAGATAILRGTVATKEEREVAEQMAAMEPGVATVRNELRIAESPRR